MKTSLNKKLMVKKLTVANLNDKQMKELRGGAATLNFFCDSKQCPPTATLDGGCNPLTKFC